MGDQISIPVCEKCGKHHIKRISDSFDRCDVCNTPLVEKKYQEVEEKET